MRHDYILQDQSDRLADINSAVKQMQKHADYFKTEGIDSSSGRRRLSRKAVVVIQLSILFIIIVGVVMLYHFLL